LTGAEERRQTSARGHGWKKGGRRTVWVRARLSLVNDPQGRPDRADRPRPGKGQEKGTFIGTRLDVFLPFPLDYRLVSTVRSGVEVSIGGPIRQRQIARLRNNGRKRQMPITLGYAARRAKSSTSLFGRDKRSTASGTDMIWMPASTSQIQIGTRRNRSRTDQPFRRPTCKARIERRSR
jgi:hypothetical protein